LYSSDIIKNVSKRVRRVFVLRPGNIDNLAISERRGLRKYRLTVESQPKRPGQSGKTTGAVRWLLPRLDQLLSMSSRKDRVDVSAVDMQTQAFPMYLPHKIQVMLSVSYPDQKKAGVLDGKMREILDGRGAVWKLDLLSERPPMKNRKVNDALADRLIEIAREWTIPFGVDGSVWPSVAGLVPSTTPVLCGLGPVGRDLYTSGEAVHRSSMVQRVLLLSQFFVRELGTSTHRRAS
jgi:D-alanine-D-alanine ligase